MPFREKTAWVSFVTTLVVWGYYFIAVLRALSTGAPDGGRLLGLLIACIAILVVMHIAAAIFLAITSPGDSDAPADERERMFGLKALRAAFYTLNSLALVVAFSSPVLAVIGPRLFPADPLTGTVIVIASAIALAIVLAELVRTGSEIFYFRRAG